MSNKVLIFGNSVAGSEVVSMTHPNAEIDVVRFPSPDGYLGTRRLTDYRIVIANYEPFHVEGSIRTDLQDRFKKEMIEAQKAGTSFCFLHYQSSSPAYDGYSPETGYMNRESLGMHLSHQLGLSVLYKHGIKAHISDSVLLHADTKREEFAEYFKLCGASHNYFSEFTTKEIQGRFDDVIQSLNDKAVTGFAVQQYAALVLYLPYQRPVEQSHRLKALTLLIDAILTYLAKSTVTLPPWASEPFFEEEREIHAALTELADKKRALESQLSSFDFAKSLLYSSERILEEVARKFLTEQLGLNCVSNERYEEDFFLVDEKAKKIAIGEIKSSVKGFKKTFIYSTYTHRENNDYDESFPALLIANCNLQAATLKEKTKPILPQDCKTAADINVLVIRVEDLLRIWIGIRAGRLERSKILDVFLTKKGWLEVTKDFEFKEHQGQ